MTGGEDRLLASGTKSYLREIGAAESQTCKLLQHATPGQEGVRLSLLEEIWSRSGEESVRLAPLPPPTATPVRIDRTSLH